MPTPLSYTLGLATGGFLGPLAGATRGLAAFLGVTASVGGVVAGVWAEISRGGALTDLSHRTGESVRDLFQLQYAFEQSGIEASAVAPLLQRYRQSLAGIGEGGESTAEAFQAIGLSITQLKSLNAPEALEKIMAALSSADRNQAAGVANAIFGRGASGNILQIARDGSAFADALKETAAQSAQMQRLAGVFDHIGDTILSLRLQLRGTFLNLAEEVAPAINGILTTLANRDFSTLGRIVELSLTVAFEKSVNFLASALTKLFAALPDLVKGVGAAGSSLLGGPLVRGFANLNAAAASDRAGRALDPADKAMQEAQAEYWASVAAATEDTASDFAREAGERFKAAARAAMRANSVDLFGGENAAALKELLKPFSPAAVAAGAQAPGGVAASNLLAGGGQNSLTGANALERVGALFGGGGGSSLADSARQTAANTRESARAIYKVNTTLERMESQSRGNFANV